jgi:ferric-dicitrate binding protein FerR (iron transport regulator)
MNPKEAIELLERYRHGESTEAERALVEQWYEQLNETGDFQWNEGEKMAMEQMIHSRLVEQIHVVQKPISEVGKLRRMRPWRWVAAASVILVMSYGLWVMSGKKSQVTGEETEVAKTNDVPAPTGTKAMITLADGTTVYLDSVAGGMLAVQNDVQVMKTAEGKVVYSSASRVSGEIVYNTLFNPRGSKVVDMTLSDGSHVWLNAGSSVKYPVAFVGNERKIEITGEAYFEVTHDAKKPFIVSKGETSVTVLGTHFNVNAYDDEDAVKVTLLEGSVKVGASDKTVTIKPGEQAQVNGGNAIGLVVNRGVDVDEVMAWKNGKFSFKGQDLELIMRAVARWYDVDIVYENKVDDKFYADIPRDTKASDVLKALELTGKVHFRIEGTKITVLK